MDITNQLLEWAKDATTVYNKISALEPNTKYYQQSPLNIISSPIENLIIGINPGSYSPGISELSPEQFLAGNPFWGNRFDNLIEGSKVSSSWRRFFGNVHYFICQDFEYHPEGFDNDSKTVWTNITPFATKSENHLKDAHYTDAIPLTARLIRILQPKRIYLLGKNIRSLLQNDCKISHVQILQENRFGRKIEIGTIDSKPYIQLPHPSGNWGFSHFFIPTIVSIWRQVTINNNSLNETASRIKDEIQQWLVRIQVLE